MYHPWRKLRALAEWTLRIAPLPKGVMGETYWPTKTITLRPDLLQAERRCTIAHELTHIERGPVPVEPVLAAREELTVEKETARRLIPIERLADALAWAHGDLHQAADELWVDVQTLRVRLEHLHPSERHYLRRRLDT